MLAPLCPHNPNRASAASLNPPRVTMAALSGPEPHQRPAPAKPLEAACYFLPQNPNTVRRVDCAIWLPQCFPNNQIRSQRLNIGRYSITIGIFRRHWALGPEFLPGSGGSCRTGPGFSSSHTSPFAPHVTCASTRCTLCWRACVSNQAGFAPLLAPRTCMRAPSVLLSTCYMPGTVLGPGNVTVNQAGTVPAPRSPGGQTQNNQSQERVITDGEAAHREKHGCD